jgi:hypothetical protein
MSVPGQPGRKQMYHYMIKAKSSLSSQRYIFFSKGDNLKKKTAKTINL